ncbi:MAG: DmsE family decaheme c-type cytochrome [Burkholderiaceae bacterium]|jgi:DmsE family decaheme c-type cytochrome|nr:DmsE family decaheme c-type cytochrome [Burkholderiaceae bacterium]
MKQKNWWKVALCGVLLTLGLAASAQEAADVAVGLSAKQRLEKNAECTRCHDESETKPILSLYQRAHGAVGDPNTPICQSCHGESKQHLDGKKGDDERRPRPDRIFGTKRTTAGYEPNNTQDQYDTCLSCHQGRLGGKHINWQSSVHANRDVGCASCHSVHASHDKVREKETQTEVCFSCHKEQRAQMNRAWHHPVPEGEMACTSCHDVHNDNPKTLIKSSTNDTCYTCHMEKRGPFVHSHQPVTEDCAICHQPHGTSVPNLLRQRAPFLCQQCHSNTQHPANPAFWQAGQATPGGPPGTIGPGGNLGARACLNCHTNIHGSNSMESGYNRTSGGHGTAGHFRR